MRQYLGGKAYLDYNRYKRRCFSFRNDCVGQLFLAQGLLFLAQGCYFWLKAAPPKEGNSLIPRAEVFLLERYDPRNKE